MNRTEAAAGRRWVIGGLLLAAGLIVAFWAAWWADRGLIASRTSASYIGFEETFQLADGWLLLCVLAGAAQLARCRPSALLWLLAGGGAGVYLLGMDVYYDLGHGIYARHGGGLIELIIDGLLAAGSGWLLAWTWRWRLVLLSGPASASAS